jgi:BirA family biotin operon repressor/biotin-[acetyl-CoA-carboxylase] ligase
MMREHDIKKKVLNIFRRSPGNFVSGEDISEKLKVSRASIWKYINKLREEGYALDAVPHLGYRLRSVPDKLLKYEVQNTLSAKTIGKKEIYHFESIGSTNNKAYELAESGEPEGTIVVAEAQTHGKGRMGRNWVSPKGGGIYFSVILRPDVETDEIPTITLIAATSVVNTIEKMCSLKAKVKWPNDIIVSGKKLGGILTEIKAQPDRVEFLILGIGINVNTPAGKLPQVGTSLKEACAQDIDRLEFFRKLLDNFEKEYAKLKKKGFISLRDECKAVSSVVGERIKVTEHHKTLEGKAIDIDEKGALILKLKDGSKKRIFSGDVTLCK